MRDEGAIYVTGHQLLKIYRVYLK